MDDIQHFINEIEAYCQSHAIAESTFGRLAVNDGKFVSRLRSGKGVTIKTIERVRNYMSDGSNGSTNGGSNGSSNGTTNHAHSDNKPTSSAGRYKGQPAKVTVSISSEPKAGSASAEPGQKEFRFYDNRQKYLMFVNTCSEKWVVAERIGMELAQVHPRPPALRVFDAGIGDGTVLTRVMRDMHHRFPTVPFVVVGKEISLEDVRLALEKVSDRFYEHPSTVMVITNLYYSEAPWLMPRNMNAAAALNWHEVPLTGTTAHEFDEQIKDLKPILTDGWQVKSSEKTGNPLYVRPSVLVLYREDQRFVVDPIIPRPGKVEAQYDLMIASQPYRANMSAEFKAQKVLAPLTRALAPGGRLIGIHSYGKDPGQDIISGIWPGREFKQSSRHELMKAIKNELGKSERDLRFNTYSDARSLFRYEMHTLPGEIGASNDSIGTSTLFAAWNNAVYVYQIEDNMITDAVAQGGYLEATEKALQKHGGLWFLNESFVVSRKRG